MKCVVFVLFVTFSTSLLLGDGQYSSALLEEQLRKLLESWRSGKLLKIKSLPFPLPSSNLIKVPPQSGTYKEGRIQFDYSTSELEVTGLRPIKIESLHISQTNNTFSININVVVPTLNIYAGAYEIYGKATYFVFSMKIEGAGDMWITIKNLRISVKITLAPKEYGTTVNDLNLKFTMEKIYVRNIVFILIISIK